MKWELPQEIDDTECRKPHGQSRCIRQKDHDGDCEHSERVLAARREGVLEAAHYARSLSTICGSPEAEKVLLDLADTLERGNYRRNSAKGV